MGLPGPINAFSANLSRQAVEDLIRILRRSERDFGAVARRARDRLLTCIPAIENGTAIDRPRHDVQPQRRTLFLNEEPWVICFNPHTRQVYRIIHGSRDCPAIFGRPTAST